MHLIFFFINYRIEPGNQIQRTGAGGFASAKRKSGLQLSLR